MDNFLFTTRTRSSVIGAKAINENTYADVEATSTGVKFNANPEAMKNSEAKVTMPVVFT